MEQKESGDYVIGVNCYGISSDLAADKYAAFTKLHEIGIREAEPVVFPGKRNKRLPATVVTEETIGEVIAAARECGLCVKSVHIFCAFGPALIPVTAVANTIRMLAVKYDIHSFVFSGMFSTAWGAKRFARYMNKLVKLVSDINCNCLYHNHNQEFARVFYNGTWGTALDCFLANVSPNVNLQLDIGWAGIGSNEVDVVRKYASRIRSLHLKDFVSGSAGRRHITPACFAPVGEGIIHTRQVIAMSNEFPIFDGSLIIDQDSSIGNIFEDIRVGYRNVITMLEV